MGIHLHLHGSLPGAIGMYSLAVGISRVGQTLPEPVYPLLSGLSAATVGIIALAAVRSSERAITDKLTRFLVYLGGIMGMLYTALWYYPVIMLGAGLTTLIWDLRYLHAVANLFNKSHRKSTAGDEALESLGNGCSWASDSQTSQDLSKPLPPTTPAYPEQRPDTPESAYRHPGRSSPIIIHHHQER